MRPFVKLDAPDRPKALYRYTVKGQGTFPFDMLRYDCAYPATSEAAYKLYPSMFVASGNAVKEQSVELRSYFEPTVGRWQSFGWSVEG